MRVPLFGPCLVLPCCRLGCTVVCCVQMLLFFPNVLLANPSLAIRLLALPRTRVLSHALPGSNVVAHGQATFTVTTYLGWCHPCWFSSRWFLIQVPTAATSWTSPLVLLTDDARLLVDTSEQPRLPSPFDRVIFLLQPSAGS